jgi:hypothetical protein
MHTIRHTHTHGRTPLNKCSARSEESNKYVPSGFRTRDPSNEAASELCLRPRCHLSLYWQSFSARFHHIHYRNGNKWRSFIVLTSCVLHPCSSWIIYFPIWSEQGWTCVLRVRCTMVCVWIVSSVFAISATCFDTLSNHNQYFFTLHKYPRITTLIVNSLLVSRLIHTALCSRRRHFL